MQSIDGNPSSFQSWVEGLKYLLQEGSIIFSPEDGGNMTLASTNTSESFFVYSKLTNQLFETWVCEKRTVVSLNFGQLHRAIRASTEKDIFSMFMERDIVDKLFIRIQGSLDVETTYSIQLLELPESNLSIPDKLVYPLSITISASMLSKCLRDMEHISASYVKFTASGNTLVLSSVNNPAEDVGHVKQESKFRSNAIEGAEMDGVTQQTEEGDIPKVYSGIYLLKYLVRIKRRVTESVV